MFFKLRSRLRAKRQIKAMKEWAGFFTRDEVYPKIRVYGYDINKSVFSFSGSYQKWNELRFLIRKSEGYLEARDYLGIESAYITAREIVDNHK